MSQLQEVLGKLGGVKSTGDGRFAARCPVPSHGKGRGDKGPSLSVGESTEGKLLLYCHAGCSFTDIVRELGLENIPPEESRIVVEYDYRDEKGQLSFQVVRFEPKGFRQRHWDGEWVWNLNGVKPVLFNLQQVLRTSGKWIFFVEGEKDVITLSHHDIVGTCIAGGANSKWRDAYTQTLKGYKVAIIPDNDEPGRKFADMVAASLHGWATVKIVDLGMDVTDWFNDGGTSKELARILVLETPNYEPPPEVTRAEFDALRDTVRQLMKRRSKKDGV